MGDFITHTPHSLAPVSKLPVLAHFGVAHKIIEKSSF